MNANQQLETFIAQFTPEVAAVARPVLARMRKRLPGAFELVYDNYNALAIGFGPTDRASQAIFSIALFPRWVSLFFLQAAGLHDPHQRLKGSGKTVRHVVLHDASVLDDIEIRSLMDDAMRRAKVPIDSRKRRRIIIKSISAKQRPRRPPPNRK
jgi:hypothetical protein